jgi:hypothetical protein
MQILGGRFAEPGILWHNALEVQDLEHRADPEGHASEKWIRFSAKNDAFI